VKKPSKATPKGAATPSPASRGGMPAPGGSNGSGKRVGMAPPKPKQRMGADPGTRVPGGSGGSEKVRKPFGGGMLTDRGIKK